ncbi:hypothetical protein [Endothiovibrio diazotrophicus]
MKKSTTAVLLSALVFPGLGHLYLKRYVAGGLLLLVTSVALYFIVSAAVDTAMDIVGELEGGSVPLDTASIAGMVEQRSHGDGRWTDFASWALLAFWVIGIVDSFRLGRRVDRVEERRDEEEG